MEEGQKENYLWRKDRRRITYGGRIEGELLMDEGQKENYLWRKDRMKITYGGRLEGELLMEEGQKANYLWKTTMPSFFESYYLTVEGICRNCSLIKQLARWNNLEKN